MITLKNKKTAITIVDPRGEPMENAKYSDLIEVCVNQPPMNHQTGQPIGFSIEDIRKRLRVVDSLKKNNGEVKMEDADYDLVIESVTGYKWLAINQEIVDFVDNVQSAKTNKN